ncbi:WbqC family protein [Cytobacillus praedii]|uniref:WbqC family protein n=1 Tax=Cytobacillus praedii TaxID=1742358 RepID=UPI00070A07FE|nr:WbqC family protein [Cytobacillus praedii]
MKIAIMQPYLFPYIGYFQLINAVDTFVIYDDVQFVNRGWINRNHILVNNEKSMFTFSLKKDSSRLKINERFFSMHFKSDRDAFLKKLSSNYKKSQNFVDVYNLIEEILDAMDHAEDISKLIVRSLQRICDYLKIHTPFVVASELEINPEARGENRIIEINKHLNSTQYINPIGGIELYSSEHFLNHNINLQFLKPRLTKYRQLKDEFTPWLSIIDILMFNSKEEISEMLTEFDLVHGSMIHSI